MSNLAITATVLPGRPILDAVFGELWPDRETAGRPATPLPLLATGEKSATSAGWTWEGVSPAADPGAHWHLLRWRSLLDNPEEMLATHPSQVQWMLDSDAGGSLLFYSVIAADCGENASF